MPAAPARATGTFSCVVDTHPRFESEALRWFAALTAVAGVDPADLVINAVGDPNTEALQYLAARGVTVRTISAFDERSPHCNKIAGALSLASHGVDGLAVLTDADVVVCRDARTLRIPVNAVGAKLVDKSHPPLEIVRAVFREAEIALPPVVPLDLDPTDFTVAGNGNGGFYAIPGPLLAKLAAAWAKWATWLLDRRELLANFAIYVDQLAMAMAVASEGLDALRLDAEWNYPTHVPEWISPDAATPAVMHYHQQVEPDGLLSTTGVVSIDSLIARVNRAISAFWPAPPQE